MNMGGSNWWDTQSVPKYEIPKGSGKHSFFANAFWIGGLNDTGGVHLAATRFRQVGEDFWPGPLNVAGEVDSSACNLHNRIYKLNKWQVDEFRHRFNEPGYVIPTDILEWPAEGNPYTEANAKAPFRDVNNDGIYNPLDGDYPAFAFNEPINKDYHLLGDQCLWWVENDKGNMHSETYAEPLGVELQVMAYAYATCNELNDQTFYRYKAINKSEKSYSDTYVAVWVDVDLGFAQDDFVACDVMEHLGYAYNGLDVDGIAGNPSHYGEHPPAAGVGILRGPRAPLSDGIDNDRDGVVDEIGERLMMSHFVYHNNSGGGGNPAQTDPTTGLDYYNYMRGVWLDGQPMCWGGNGHPASGGDINTPCDFMFPGDSDPLGYGTGGVSATEWTEQTAGNVPFDRRFLVSTGPFDFNSGDTVNFHYGALWARDTTVPYPDGSVQKLVTAKNYCQEQFDLNFQGMDCCPPKAEIHLLQPTVNQFMFSSIYEADEYFWDFGNGLTSNEPFPEPTFYLDFDTYDVTLIVENDCGSDTAIIQVSRQFFDVPELEASQINVYPNPSSDAVFIQAETNLLIEGVIVYDVRGRELVNRNLQGVSNYAIKENLSQGVYTLLIQSSEGIVRKRVVIK